MLFCKKIRSCPNPRNHNPQWRAARLNLSMESCKVRERELFEQGKVNYSNTGRKYFDKGRKVFEYGKESIRTCEGKYSNKARKVFEQG